MFSVLSLRRRVTVSARSPDQPECRSGRPRDHHLARFARDRRGNVAMIFAMMSTLLFLMIGAAVDFGRWMHARQQNHDAMDAAALAGLKAYQSGLTLSGYTLDDSAEIIARKYYDQNRTTSLPIVETVPVTFTLSNNNTTMTANGVVKINTPFLKLAGIPSLNLYKGDASGTSSTELS